MSVLYYELDNGVISHSAKGTSWSKEKHKYVKKENGKYYYNKKTTDVSEKSKTEMGFDLELTKLAYDQTKEKQEVAQKEYDETTEKLFKAYASNDGQSIGFWTKQRDKKLERLKEAQEAHKKQYDRLNGLVNELVGNIKKEKKTN